jgi:Carbohydrate family 9 binding domain-like
MTFSEEFVPLTPINFFQISADCCYLPPAKFPNLTKAQAKKYLLPDTSELCSEESFADVSLGWNEEGLEAYIQVRHPFKRAHYPDVARGDSVELFMDTRDVKTSGFNTRFCHHFFFLAEGVEGHLAGEMTRFRTEDVHPLCDPNELKVKSLIQSNGYSLNIFIPSHCLYGYDPDQFNRLGFAYRINQSDGFSQHFTVVTEDFPIEQQPALWGSLMLKR